MHFVTLYYDGISKIHLEKDIVKITEKLSNKVFTKSFVSFYQDLEVEELADKIDDVEFIFLGVDGLRISNIWRSVKYLIQNACKIDILNLYHPTIPTMFLSVLYNSLNKNGRIYLKMDMDLRGSYLRASPFKRSLLGYFLRKRVALVSIESTLMLRELLDRISGIEHKSIYLPSGIDKDNMTDGKSHVVRLLRKKENIILTCSRLGAYQKNNELLLEALPFLDLDNWQVVLVGPIENKNIIDRWNSLKMEFPQLEKKVEFTGAIYDRNELYDYYEKAKIFCLTSRWESFGLVLLEALYSGCHLITTDIESAADITANGKYGKIVSSEKFAEGLEHLMDYFDTNAMDETRMLEQFEYVQSKYLWSECIKELERKLVEEKINLKSD